MRERLDEEWPAMDGAANADSHGAGSGLARRLQYLPALVLLLLGGLPFLFVLSEPSRFMAGQPEDGAGTPPASVQVQLQQLTQRVERLESRLTAVAAPSDPGLAGQVRLIPPEGGSATLQFEGVDLEVFDRRRVELDARVDERR